jgi:hypothetical protein
MVPPQCYLLLRGAEGNRNTPVPLYVEHPTRAEYGDGSVSAPQGGGKKRRNGNHMMILKKGTTSKKKSKLGLAIVRNGISQIFRKQKTFKRGRLWKLSHCNINQ